MSRQVSLGLSQSRLRQCGVSRTVLWWPVWPVQFSPSLVLEEGLRLFKPSEFLHNSRGRPRKGYTVSESS